MDKKFSDAVISKIEKLIKSVSVDIQEERSISHQFILKFDTIFNETTLKGNQHVTCDSMLAQFSKSLSHYHFKQIVLILGSPLREKIK